MGNSSLRVLFLPLYPETVPSSRLRVYQYLPYLKQFGIEGVALPAIPEPWFSHFYYSSSKGIHFIQYAAEAVRNVLRLLRGRRFDLIFIQKGILCTNLRGFDQLARGTGRPLVFDLDDSVYGRNLVEFRLSFLKFLQDGDQTAKVSSQCRAVVAGNRYLGEQALQFNRKVFVIPTPVDTRRFLPRREDLKPVRKETVIGWIGMHRGLPYVQSLERVFQTLSRRYPIRVRLITRAAKQPFRLDGVETELIPWSYETEVQAMQGIDIGVMPLFKDEWTEGKCSLKVLQYMALGLPSVSSRLGTNEEVIADGQDGFLAGDEEEWVRKLSELIEDASLRKKMGEAARSKVVERYSLERMAPRLAEVLKEAAS